MDEATVKALSTKDKVSRCVDWLKEQNNPKKLSLQNKNDIQFIIETNAHRKKFFLTAEDDATVPAGVGEVELEPKNVPVQKLRHESLSLECDWNSCRELFSDYSKFQAHVKQHASEIYKTDEKAEYHCLWDICGHKTTDIKQILRHINYHAYHAKLLAIGFNARATLKLERCKKDSSKRNQLPPLLGDHCCMWFGCKKYYDSMQEFLNHTNKHVEACNRGEIICSWAGCGVKFRERALLKKHLRTHTGERLIACYHCGTHFALNCKLCDHLLRQNVDPAAGHKCSICGEYFASDYLLREHVRRHVSCYACSLCDMSQPTPADLAHHMRYRHIASEDVRCHKCPECDYTAVTKYDLRAHMRRHNLKRKSDNDSDSEIEVKKQKVQRTYICHICPENKRTTFARGTYLTMHLVKIHGAQWPCGHSRFRYQKSEDGLFRLTTIRFEMLEVSEKIVDGCRGPNATLSNKYDFDIKKVSDFTATTPTRYDICIKNDLKQDSKENVNTNNEITKKKQEEPEIEVKKDVKVKKKPATRRRTKRNVRVKKSKRKSKKNVAIEEEENEETSQVQNDEIIDEIDSLEIDRRENRLSVSSDLGEANQTETFAVKVKEEDEDNENKNNTELVGGEGTPNTALEIEMCDVDADGNVISTKRIHSQIIYSY